MNHKRVCVSASFPRKKKPRQRRFQSVTPGQTLLPSAASLLPLPRAESPEPSRAGGVISLPLHAELTIHRGSPRSARSSVSHGPPVSHGARGRRCPRDGQGRQMTGNMKRALAPLATRTCLFRKRGVGGGEREKKKTRFPSSLSRENRSRVRT